LAGQVERVGVGAIGRKHFRAYRNDFGVHGLKV
jgi:hypothetical protein